MVFLNWCNLKKMFRILRQEGLPSLIRRLRKFRKTTKSAAFYRKWIVRNEPTVEELAAQYESTFPSRPLISFICPAYKTKRRHLYALIRSLQNQTYPNWELCIADGGSDVRCVRRLKHIARTNPHVRIATLQKNLGICGNSQAAAEIARGDFFAFVDHDDVLPPFAAYELIKAVNAHPKADFFYSDEDKLSAFGRYDPRFKPDWSPDTLRSYNYITHIMMLSRALFTCIGGFREGYDGSQDHDLALRAGDSAREVVHIPKILYHWRAHSGSVAGGSNKQYAFEAGRKSVESALRRQSDYADVTVEQGLFLSSYRARYKIEGEPLVSIIIPNRNKAALLKNCIDSIRSTAGKQRIELLIVENGSVEESIFEYYKKLEQNSLARILHRPQPFNYSAANNYGAMQAKGDLLLFLNNDIHALQEGWLEALMEQALRPNVGAVGAKLLYGNGKVQHAGVVVGMGGWADHVCAGMDEYASGCNHIINVVRNVSAVTGACLMTQREKFEKAGGFDERFVLCGSDVELCLRYHNKGWVNIYTPFARLEHLESATRKGMRIPQGDYDRSLDAYRPLLLHGDPYYNVNLDYAQKTPALAANPTPPIWLNSMASAGRA